eukprot:1222954-Karenia_brevis.AAC.1
MIYKKEASMNSTGKTRNLMMWCLGKQEDSRDHKVRLNHKYSLVNNHAGKDGMMTGWVETTFVEDHDNPG